MGVDNSIWTTIIMYMIAAVILGILTYLWLTFRLKKKQRDDAIRNQTMGANQSIDSQRIDNQR
ncbi:hypothetical protein MOTT16_01990 [Moraxella osloensis]|jgi:heme/copper-type cytochrome/quinol oxidase subunit 2|uniref:Heme exporter protein D n=3 Tax=Pseudomonadota TaxID=1224 RepID=A0A0X8K7I5_FAUOS|nr:MULTISPECIES: hypothetical protein [Bacteria]EEV22916.1 hypothetical protein ENHAE0001_1228 [Enhydrobacter aerosaccus SK60]NOX77287.1 hypothetical protein [Gammaproteobacteria bacterium]GGL93264.1 hypothetical protein GCM10010099_06890 [Streptomyces cinereus]HCN15880.1 hypothetical protein [Moraxellaceae bacterium]AME01862.1 hypothetical protein AXE82_08910 [Moraxella osloensis]